MNFATRPAWIALAILGPAILLGSTYVVFVYLESTTRGLGFDTAARKVNPAQVGYIVAAMVLGLIASHIFQRASAAADGTFHIGQTIKDMPRVGRFWAALAVSPMVFLGVLTGIGDTDLTFAHYLLAFQNGFFWETVIGRPAGTLTPTPATEPAPYQPDAGASA